jgi:UDP-N-acetylglucosamine acyltransferase
MSIIGGCSKVVQDIPPYMLADGNPATTRALNKEGLKRNEVSPESQAALKQAHRILFRENLTFTKGVEKTRAEVPASEEIEHLLTFIDSSQRGIAR